MKVWERKYLENNDWGKTSKSYLKATQSHFDFNE